MVILFRVDANERTGIGHVTRCFALAQGLKAAGHKILWLGKLFKPEMVQAIQKQQVPILEEQNFSSIEEEINTISRYTAQMNIDWVVLDGYQFDEAYQVQLRKKCHVHLLWIDDPACIQSPADVVVNQNIYATPYLYEGKVSNNVSLLTGTAFALLRPEFMGEVPQRQFNKVQQVLLTLGGTQPFELLSRFVRLLDDLKEDFALDVVIGSGSYQPLLAYAKEHCASGRRINLCISPGAQEMRQLMAKADLAISAAGSTCWELCRLGTPMLLVILADNQEKVAEEMGRQAVAINAGWANQLTDQQFQEIFLKLFYDQKLRSQFSQTAQSRVDGRGVRRVIEKLEELVGVK